MGFFITTLILMAVIMTTILVLEVNYTSNSIDIFIVGLIYSVLAVLYTACTEDDWSVSLVYITMIFVLILLGRLSLSSADEYVVPKVTALLGTEILIIVMTNFKIAFTVALAICIVYNIRRFICAT